MKKTILTLIAIFLATLTYAQSGINYKALITNNGNAIANQAVTVKFTVLANGTTSVYQETQAVTTDANGIVSVQIGEGTQVSGNFSTIDFATPQSLKVEINSGSGFVDFGTNALKYVPKAKYADKAGSVDYSNITNVPAGIADGDDDTHLTEAQVDIMVNNNGYAKKINDLTDAISDNDGSNNGSSIFIGVDAGASDDQTDNMNVGIGYSALSFNNTGYKNVATGSEALIFNLTGNDNTAVGAESLGSNEDGNNNVAIGTGAGSGNESGSGNIFIGHEAGSNEMGSDKLYIDNSDTTSPLIYGNFNTNELKINGTLKISGGAPGVGKVFTSDANGKGSWQTPASGGASQLNDLTDARRMDRAYYIGQDAGNADDGSNGLYNVGIGHEVLKYNTDGDNETAVGYKALYSNTTGSNNTAYGYYALSSNKANYNSVAIGYSAMKNADNRTSGRETYNTAIGYESLKGSATPINNTGQYNVALGYHTLLNNTSGWKNTANGNMALKSNTTGNGNTALGNETLKNNTEGDFNIAIGLNALYYNTAGEKSTVVGTNAASTNKAGNNITAIGYHALYHANDRTFSFINDNVAVGFEAIQGSEVAANNTGLRNTAVGYRALSSNTSGDSNTANGYHSLEINTTGSYNTANGKNTLIDNTEGNMNVAIGMWALDGKSTASYNTAIGYNANGANANSYTNTTAIGYNAQISADNSIRLGNDAVTWIGGHSAWQNTSDGRFKRNVKETVPGLDFITKLRPVTYTWDLNALDKFNNIEYNNEKNLDLNMQERVQKEQVIHTGFIAQEVEAAAKETNFDFDGVHHPANDKDAYSLAYAEFVVPLVKAVQEQQVIIQSLKDKNKATEDRVKALEQQIEQIKLQLQSK